MAICIPCHCMQLCNLYTFTKRYRWFVVCVQQTVDLRSECSLAKYLTALSPPVLRSTNLCLDRQTPGGWSSTVMMQMVVDDIRLPNARARGQHANDMLKVLDHQRRMRFEKYDAWKQVSRVIRRSIERDVQALQPRTLALFGGTLQ